MLTIHARVPANDPHPLRRPRPRGDAALSLLPDLDAFRSAFGGLDGADLIRALAAPGGPLRHRTALVSAFGSESVVLLHTAAEVDPGLPVIFLDTGKHFPETLAYRDRLVGRPGPTDIRTT